MKIWLEAQLRLVSRALRRRGIAQDILEDAEVHVSHGFHLCRAYCIEDGIYVAWWYVVLCRWLKRERQLRGLLRHELAHVLAQWEDVRETFGLPDYFKSRWPRFKAELAYVGRGLRDYGAIHPEEAFAEDVRKMDRETLRLLADVTKL